MRITRLCSARNALVLAKAAAARKAMKKKRILIAIDLGIGKAVETVMTCDLSVDYVKENALYTT